MRTGSYSCSDLSSFVVNLHAFTDYEICAVPLSKMCSWQRDDTSLRKQTNHNNSNLASSCWIMFVLFSGKLTFTVHQNIHIGLLYRLGQNKWHQLSFLLVAIECINKTESYFTRTRVTSYVMQQISSMTANHTLLDGDQHRRRKVLKSV